MKKLKVLMAVVTAAVSVFIGIEAKALDGILDSGNAIFRKDDLGTPIIGWYVGNSDGYSGVFGFAGPLFLQTTKKVYGVYGVVSSSNADSCALYGVSIGSGYGMYSKGKAKVEGNLTITGAVSSPATTNLALTADSAVASTVYNASYSADKIKDGIYGRWDNGEWASLGEQAGAWIQLEWAAPIACNKIIIYPRVNKYDQINDGWMVVLRQDGTVTEVHLGQFSNGGAPRELHLLEAEGTNVVAVKILITETSADTKNIGLAEIEIFRDHNIW